MPVIRIPDRLLQHLTPAEAERYELLLQREIALASPLDLACWLRPETKRWAHIEYINEHLVALVEHRLYPSGPGPRANWFYVQNGKTLPALSPDHIPENVEDFYGLHPVTNERVVYRLAIAAPPRHGKSYIVTETFPIWYWMRYPDRDIALATYSDEFASDWGVKIRDRICEEEYRTGLKLVGGARSAAAHLRLEGESAKYEQDELVRATGEMFLVGSRGGLTGKGFQAGIIDDPFKDAADAESQAERNARANWYTSVFTYRKTRLPGKGIPVEVMMFTRWNIDDLAGRFVYDEEGNPRPDWCSIRLPALAEADDPLGRAEGDALCPPVKTKTELLELQDSDPYWFAAMYQGTPVVRKGGIIPPFRRYTTEILDGDAVYRIMPVPHEELPTFPGSEALQEELQKSFLIPAKRCTRYATVDLAASKASYADWSVFSVWDWDHETGTLILVGCVRERVESAQHMAWVKRCFGDFERISFVGVESKTFGLTLLQELIQDRTIPVRPLEAEGDKVSRATPYGQAIGRGRIVIPRAGIWVNHWVSEHASFPGGKHDDMVDTGSYAWKVSSSLPKMKEAKREPVTTEEKIQAYVERKARKRRRPGYLDLMQ